MTRRFVVAAVALFGLAAVVTTPPQGADACNPTKVTICHATASDTNPYTINSVDESSIDAPGNRYLNGHGDHERDIIPPFRTFPGRNWDEAGQAIWNNGCQVPVVLQEVTPLAPGLLDPTCDAPGEVVLPTVTGVEYATTTNPDGSVTTTATADEGYVFTEGSTTTWTHTADQLAQLPADHPMCLVVEPPVVEPPVVEPPVVEPPVVEPPVVQPPEQGEVASGGVTAPVTPTPTAASTPATLPATGNETWAIFLIGLATLLTGTVLHGLARRTT
jgi:LPXTG-motif cell wall-anchored protein